MDDWRQEPVALLIALDHGYCLLDVENAVRRGETEPANNYLWARRDLDVAQPVGVAAKGTHNDDLGTRFSVLHHLEDGFAAPPGATPDMDQEQKAAAKQAAATPVVQVNRSP